MMSCPQWLQQLHLMHAPVLYTHSSWEWWSHQLEAQTDTNPHRTPCHAPCLRAWAEMQQEADSLSDFDFSDDEDEESRRYVVRGAKNNPNAQSKELSLGQLRKVSCNS